MNQLYTRQGFMQNCSLLHLREKVAEGRMRGKLNVYCPFSLRPWREKVGVARMRGKCNGFTLIELLVVVLIIGILSAVAVPQYQKAVMKSRLASALTYVNAANKAMELYVLENGFPAANRNIYLTGPNKTDEVALDIPCTGVAVSNSVITGLCKPEGLPFWFRTEINNYGYGSSICFDTLCDSGLWFETTKNGTKSYKCALYGAEEPGDTYCKLIQQLVPAQWTVGY